MVVKNLKPIKLNKYSGRNTFSDVTNIGPSEFREITNFDIYGGMNGDYLRTRRGSELLVPESDPIALPDDILNKVVFPTLGGEYFIYNVGLGGQGEFYAQKEGENPFQIVGPFFDVEGDAAAFLSDPVFTGLTPGVTYTVTIEDFGGTSYQVTLLDGMTIVAQGDSAYGDTPETLALIAVGGSGISGTFEVAALVVGDTPQTGTLGLISLNVGSNVNPVDMKVYNDRVYVFSPTGNKIIYYDADADTLYGRPMGLEAFAITDFQPEPGNMDAGALVTYGVEKVIQKDGADLVASGPNRVLEDGLIATYQLAEDGTGVLIRMYDSILLDPYWTHLRLWRSKNQVSNLSNPLAPIDAQGTPDVLYEVALITRAEMSGTIAPVDTGGDLPPGNVGVEAGFSGDYYGIEDHNDDSVLIKAIGLDLIGLIPLPGCRTGTVNKGRIWASGIGDNFIAPNGPNIDPVIREDWLYTTEQFSQYQEQWDAQAYLNAGRDGERTESLLTLLEDVIGFRNSTTRRIASGNPASLVQMLDDKVGVPSFRCTGYITGIGICAVCSDGYFRYLGFDQRWHQYIGKTEISQSIYDLTAPVVANPKADFVYMNGKLLMLIPDGAIAALGVKEGKGWSLYDYPETFAAIFNFADGERAAAAQDERFLLEIETAETTDADFTDVDGARIDITASFEGFAFSGEGKLLEINRYSFWGKLSSVPTVTAKSSGQTWRVSSGFIDPGLFAANEDLNEREYVFNPQPLDTTPFKWMPLRGQFITFGLSLIGPAMISWQKVEGKIRETNGDLGVFPDGGFIPQGPGWDQSSLFVLNFEDPANTFYDASGKGLNHTWSAGTTPTGSKTNRVTQKPGKGVRFEPNGSISYATDPSSTLMGTSNLTWKMVVSTPDEGGLSASGKNGAYSWRLLFNPGGVSMSINANGTQYTYAIQGFTPVVSQVYALVFCLKKDFTGTFWIESTSSSTFTEKTTARAAGSVIPPIPTGHALASYIYDSNPDSSITLSFYSIEKTTTQTEQAKRFWGVVKAY